ncbi:MAG: hypothetical protein M3291_04270 [Actinomycetota bacterium]|nr:hypothetical protein [Actinomycetota bacterium]
MSPASCWKAVGGGTPAGRRGCQLDLDAVSELLSGRNAAIAAALTAGLGYEVTVEDIGLRGGMRREAWTAGRERCV